MLANRKLEASIMPQHLIAAEIHGITSLYLPAMIEAIVAFCQKAHIMMHLGEWFSVCTPTLLVSAQ